MGTPLSFRSVASRVLKRIAVSSVCVGAFIVLTQDLQVFPSIVPRLLGVESAPTPEGIAESFVTTQDGVRIRVWEMLAKNDERAVVLLLHGNADTLPNRVGLRSFMAERGISSFSFEYRGSGLSEGLPSEQGIYRDGEAVMDMLHAKKKITPDKVAIIGISVGTGPASYLAQRYKAGKLVLISPYFSIRDLVGEMPLYGMLVPFFKYRFPTAEYLALAPGTQISIFHGARDTTIPIAHSERIVASLPDSSRYDFIRVDNAGHNDILQPIVSDLIERLVK